MLVLTRKVGEGIRIGDDIVITVVEMKNGAIRLGIVAPPTVKIHRREVYERILAENKEATQWVITDLDSLSASLPTVKEVK